MNISGRKLIFSAIQGKKDYVNVMRPFFAKI